MKKKNTIDAGHGGNDSGAIGLNKTKESNIALDVAKKIDSYLKKCAIENNMTRTTDTTLSLAARTNTSNNNGSNTFVSVHCNSYNDPNAHGLEILYMSDAGKRLSEMILEELKKDNLYIKIREGGKGIKYQNTHVCRETKAVACLVEMGFITNKKDYDLIVNNKDRFAKAIAKGICKYNGVAFVEGNNNNSGGGSATGTTYYRVVTNSYLDKSLANKEVDKLKAIGESAFLDAFKKDNKTYYRVVAGSFTVKSNADDKVRKLKSKGYSNTFIAMYKK